MTFLRLNSFKSVRVLGFVIAASTVRKKNVCLPLLKKSLFVDCNA